MSILQAFELVRKEPTLVVRAGHAWNEGGGRQGKSQFFFDKDLQLRSGLRHKLGPTGCLQISGGTPHQASSSR